MNHKSFDLGNGEIIMSLKEELHAQKQFASWDMLRVNHEQNALILVDQSLDLIDVAFCVATDDAKSMKKWLDEILITRATKEQIAKWEIKPLQDIGEFIIIQPYVLLQLID